MFNNNEIGKPNDPGLIYPITRIHNDGEEKNFKLLGVLFDEYLSFEDHINNLCNKISKSLFCMNRVKNFVNSKAMKTLYFAMVHSHISYCINVYSCANITTLNKLILKQKEAIRIVCNAGYRDHTSPLFKQQRILPLTDLIKFSNLKFMHKFSYNRLPISFSEMWVTNRVRNPNVILRNADDLYVPAHHFATTKRFQFFSFPKIWNDCDGIKLNPNENIFTKSVKSALINALVV
jgi:hypothetical protein